MTKSKAAAKITIEQDELISVPNNTTKEHWMAWFTNQNQVFNKLVYSMENPAQKQLPATG